MTAPHTSWDDSLAAWRAKSPAFTRYEARINRSLDDFWRGEEAALTRRVVQVSTRKYRARKKRR